MNILVEKEKKLGYASERATCATAEKNMTTDWGVYDSAYY